jgi:hypothetical protein
MLNFLVLNLTNQREGNGPQIDMQGNCNIISKSKYNSKKKTLSLLTQCP